MFFFSKIVVDPGDAVKFDQSNLVFNQQFEIIDVVAYDPNAPPDNCDVLFRIRNGGFNCNGSEVCTITIPGSIDDDTTIIFRVRYDPKSIIGAGPVACVNNEPVTTDTYTFTALLNNVAQQTDSVDVNPKDNDTCNG